MELIQTQSSQREGNACLIKDEVVMFRIHEKYVVVDIRRYIGWCDNGLDYRYRKEFDKLEDATDYFNKLNKSGCNL